MPLDFPNVPFSAPLSYLAIGHHAPDDWGRRHPGGLVLRTVRTSARTPFVARMIPLAPDGSELRFTRFAMEPEILRAGTPAGTFEFAFADPDTVLVRADRPGIGLRLDFLPEGTNVFDAILPVPAPDAPGGAALLANLFKNGTRFLLAPRAGRLEAGESGWDGRDSARLTVDLRPGVGDTPVEFSLREYVGEWDGAVPGEAFANVVSARAAEFAAFLDRIPAVPAALEDARRAAAHMLWSFSVARAGALGRSAILMSKNWMNRIWSWDHCFNAIALAPGLPDLAWDQFMAPFDLQDSAGMLPDDISEGGVGRNYVKPPIHGWALRRMMRAAPIPAERLAEAYGPLSRWTRWWFTRRDRDHDGLCEYNHGNDSGWDNSTAFIPHPPVATPDLAAFLAIQCDVLADLARRLCRPDAEVADWMRLADAQIAAMDRVLFDAEAHPLVFQPATGSTSRGDTLMLRLPVLLGDRLPARLRAPLLADLESTAFRTAWGWATESPASPLYVPDGYWRGPIWAPSTMLLCDGLRACGRPDLADQAAESFCRMCARSGFAENFDALTGEGLRDRAYTWTAAVFLILASEL